jgi:hypothetical protein
VPEPTEIAGRYQVVKKLGAGAFGTVYKAKDKILGRMVAIKTIRLEGLAAAGTSLDELLDRFKREAQVSAQLKHPNIVTIYDIGDSDGMSYLAMEFIDGEGLERVIAQGKLSLERAASIGVPGGGRPRLRPPAQRRPPRHQAREHHARVGRPGEGHRLRNRQGHRLGPTTSP